MSAVIQPKSVTTASASSSVKRRLRSRTAWIVTAAMFISWGGPAANAFWQSLSSSNFAAAKADSVPAVAAPSASVTGGIVSVSWAAGSTAAGRPVSGYTLARYAAASGGTKVPAGGTCAGTLTALNCTESGLPAGTWYYTVTPALTLWQGAESARSTGVAGDSTPPAAPTVTAPAIISGTNVASVPVSGTAEAGSSVNVTVTDPGTAHTATQTVMTNGSGQWAATNFNLSTFSDGTITYRAVATDAAGNASAPGSTTSNKDATAPAAVVSLVNGPDTIKNVAGFADPGDKVVIRYSEPMNASSICSTWTSNSLNYTINANNLVTVTIDAANVLSVTLPTGTCSPLRIGDVALSGTYVGSAPLVFKGSGTNNVSAIAWEFATNTLTISLGKIASGTKAPNPATSGVPVLTPPAGITDLVGNAMSTSASPGTPSRF